MNKKLIITGFARSGTSLITKFLNFNGYDTGGNWVEEDNAGYEDEDFQKLITTFQMNAKTESLILFLINEIKKIDKDIKTIFISGYTSDIIKTQGLLGQGSNLLTKPVMTDKLLEKVKEVLKNAY